MSGVLAVVGVPAYGQTAGVGNSGQGVAGSGGNSSVGNNSTNATANGTTASTVPPTLLGSVVGIALNLTTTATNTSNGTSAVTTGGAQASGNNSDSGVRQASAGGGGGPFGTVFSPFATPLQAAGVSNSGVAAASSGGNSGVGNNSTNVAGNTQTVSSGLINVGLQLANTASNNSNGTSTINTGAASASGNTSTNAVDQARVGGGGFGGGGFGGGGFGPGGRFAIGGGAACDGFFGLGGGQRVEVANNGTGAASTGDNASVGNQSQNVTANNNNLPGGLVSVNAPGLLGNNVSNSSDGQSTINTGPAAASGNQSTSDVGQLCVEHEQPPRFLSPPVITPPGFRRGVAQVVVPVVGVGGVAGQQQLARTGADPFVLALVAFALLFGGFLFMVWERVESYPSAARTPTA